MARAKMKQLQEGPTPMSEPRRPLQMATEPIHVLIDTDFINLNKQHVHLIAPHPTADSE
jgi:hypothetical protein